jgi:hypothetical protein|tara:strand:+ start:512 stop:1144 length:633 start_codon:yes stop_codon:yes gene_type:complete
MVDILAGDNKERPCYIEFELRADEDRNASIEAGMPVYKDVEYAKLTPAGSQGTLVSEKVVTEQLLNEWRNGNRRGDRPIPYYLQAYDAWKQGLEVPVNGSSVKHWPGVTPAQLRTCQEAGIQTVEDLALSNADSIRRLGMGGLALVKKAKIYLENAETNKAAEEISALQIKIETMEELIHTQSEQIAALQNDSEARPSQAKRGRPRKEAA